MTNLDGAKVERKRPKEEKQPTKVVVRHLPPSMNLDSFLDQATVPPYDYICYGPADKTLTPHCTSRVYINFLNVEDLLIFTQKFDGYVFLDNKGHEYPAVVEFAPFQRIARSKSNSGKKPNTKCGTIESDPYFIEFKKNLLEEREKAGSRSFKQHYFETNTENEEKKKITDTPLLQYLRNRNAEKAKTRDEKREERKRKEAERKKTREEQQSLRRAQAKKLEQETTSNIVYTGGPYGNKRDTYSRRKADDRVKPARDKNIPVRNSDGAKSKVSQKSHEQNDKVTSSQKDEKKFQDASAPFQDPAIIEMRVHSSAKPNSRYKEDSQLERRQKGKEDRKLNDGKFQKTKDRTDARSRDKDRGDRYVKNRNQDEFPVKTKPDAKPSEENSSNKSSDAAAHPESSKAPYKSSGDHRNTPNNSESGEKYRNRKNERTRGNHRDSKPNQCHRDADKSNNQPHRNTDDKGGNKVIKGTDRGDAKSEKAGEKYGKVDRGGWKHNKYGDRVEPKMVDKTNLEKSPKKIDKPTGKLENSAENQKSDAENVDPKRGKSAELCSKTVSALQRRNSFEEKQPERFVETGRRNSMDSGNNEEEARDRKSERRIRNKDRPSIAIYRPGMGRFSKQRITTDRSPDQGSPSNSPSPTN